ncbi:MAG: hypothetical protein ACXVP5_04365 [Tumebacillaceae bacterium]
MTKRRFEIPKAEGIETKSKGLPHVDVTKVSDGKILFAYNFLDLQHEAFNCGGTTTSWFLHLHENLSEISRLSPDEFRFQMRNHYDVHGHDFEQLDYKYRLPGDMLQQVESDCIQFRLSSSGGRVHGFFIENRLYIVWLDPHHNLYPSQRHGGRSFFDKPLSPYDELLLENASLQETLQEQQVMLDELTKP